MISINTNIFRIMLITVQLQAGRGRERTPFESGEHSTRGSCQPRTWLRVSVVHGVSIELQQLLRFSFFLPVAAHSKCILTNLRKITKLRWHRVTTTRQSKALTNAAR